MNSFQISLNARELEDPREKLFALRRLLVACRATRHAASGFSG